MTMVMPVPMTMVMPVPMTLMLVNDGAIYNNDTNVTNNDIPAAEDDDYDDKEKLRRCQ